MLQKCHQGLLDVKHVAFEIITSYVIHFINSIAILKHKRIYYGLNNPTQYIKQTQITHTQNNVTSCFHFAL